MTLSSILGAIVSDIINAALSWVRRVATGRSTALAQSQPIDTLKARDLVVKAGLATLEFDIDDGLAMAPGGIEPIDIQAVRDIGAALGESQEQIEARVMALTSTSAGQEIVVLEGPRAFVYDFKDRLNTVMALAAHGTLYFIHPEDEKNTALPFEEKRKIAFGPHTPNDVSGDTPLFTQKGILPVGYVDHLRDSRLFAREYGLLAKYLDPKAGALDGRKEVDRILGTTEAVDLDRQLPPSPGKDTPPQLPPPPL
jgi:hypothetical protein